MFKIGDFSKFSRVSVKALRYYDEIDLLKPSAVDQSTGYRYYSADQLSRLNHIVALKNLGLSLEEIIKLINNNLNPTQVQETLLVKRTELQKHLLEEHKRLEQVEKLLKQIEKEGTMPDYQIVIKKVEPQIIASIRTILPTYAEVGKLFNDIFGYLGHQNIAKPAGPTMFICHDSEFKEKDVDVEVGVPLSEKIPSSGSVSVYELPGLEKAACTIYKGAYEDIGEAYNAIMSWLENNGYQITGPDRELYLTSPVDTSDPSQYVTEIQFPVIKI